MLARWIRVHAWHLLGVVFKRSNLYLKEHTMLSHILYTRRELAVYPEAMMHFLKGASPTMMVQILLFLITGFLYYEHISHALMWVFAAALIGMAVLLIVFIRSLLNSGDWYRQESQIRAGLTIMILIFIAFVAWNVYILYVLYYRFPNFSLVLLFACTLGILAISAIGSFSKLFYYAIGLMILTRLVVVAVFLPEIFYRSMIVTMADVLLCVFVFLYNRKIIESIRIKVENANLVEDLKNKNDHLENLTLSQSRYLSAASHDLRQPLHALSLIINDIQNKNDDAILNPSIAQMNHALDALIVSFDSMHKLSQLDSGVIKPVIKSFPVARVLNRLNDDFHDIVHGKNLTWRIAPSKLWGHSDENLVYQVLSHYVVNAIAHTHRGGILIGVHPRPNGLCLAVYDTGAGIAQEKIDTLFKDAQRLQQAGQRDVGGVGLGLAIANRLSRLLKTPLEVRSKLHRGSMFGIVLPKGRVTEEVSHVDTVPLNIDHISGKKVALLEDNFGVAQELETLLSSWGMEVTPVLSVQMLEEACVEEGVFDLIIADYHLGLINETGLDSIRLLKQKQTTHAVQSVLISGDTSNDLAQLAKQENVLLLAKPIRPARFRVLLNQLLAG